MGWLARLLHATPKEELEGIRLDTSRPFWELEGKTDFPALFRALSNLLPEGSMLYFEGGFPRGELLDFFCTHAMAEPVHVAVGTLWPRPTYYHVPATADNLAMLAELAEHCAEPELAIHFHAYHGQTVLLQWHDAFAQPMLLAADLAEAQVRDFAQTLSMKATQQGVS